IDVILYDSIMFSASILCAYFSSRTILLTLPLQKVKKHLTSLQVLWVTCRSLFCLKFSSFTYQFCSTVSTVFISLLLLKIMWADTEHTATGCSCFKEFPVLWRLSSSRYTFTRHVFKSF